jgi:hypothetical protein
MASMRLTRLTSGPITVKFEAIGRSEVAVDDRAIVEDDDDFHRRFARRRRSRTPDTERRQRRAPCRRATEGPQLNRVLGGKIHEYFT